MTLALSRIDPQLAGVYEVLSFAGGRTESAETVEEAVEKGVKKISTYADELGNTHTYAIVDDVTFRRLASSSAVSKLDSETLLMPDGARVKMDSPKGLSEVEVHSIEDVLTAKSTDTRTSARTIADVTERVEPDEVVLPTREMVDRISAARRAELDRLSQIEDLRQSYIEKLSLGELADEETIYYANELFIEALSESEIKAAREQLIRIGGEKISENSYRLKNGAEVKIIG